jgi:nucleoside-diphosphate-sugar epimerase
MWTLNLFARVVFSSIYNAFVEPIKHTGAIISNYGGDKKEPWVHPLDIADVIAEEIDKPFSGRTVRYVASDEASPNEVAKALGKAIGKSDLEWKVISDEELLENWLNMGFNEQLAKGFIELQRNMGIGALYEDYYQYQPVLGKMKLVDFAKEFVAVYNAE